MRTLVAVMFLAMSATPAIATSTPTHYFHGSTSAVTVPGGTTTTYLNATAPTSSTVKSISEQVNSNAGPITIGTFRSVAFATASTIETLAVAAVNLSANSVMHSCAQVTATLYRVSSGGALTPLGTGQTGTDVRIEQGSNQGTVGFTEIPVRIDVSATLDRTIPVGAGIEVKIQVASVGCGNRRVFLAYDATGAQTRVDFPGGMVDLFGASGSFGLHVSTLTSGHSLVKVPVPNWGFDEGQTAFFPTVTSDGTVLISNMTQTFNEFMPTACSMAVTCFNPDEPTCRSYTSPSTWTAERFSNIYIPTIDGAEVVPSGGCAALQGTCTSGACVGAATPCPGAPTPAPTPPVCTNGDQCDKRSSGAPVDDLEVLGDPGSGTERVMFSSALGSTQSSASGFPTLGTLKKMTDGTWDVESTISALDLRQSNATEGPAACSVGGVGCDCSHPCPDGGTCNGIFCEWGTCTTDGDCPDGFACGAFGLCGVPSCKAVTELAKLPHSGHVVAMQYAGASLIVVDAAGALQAHLDFPAAPNDCAGGYYPIIPRQVDVDPSTDPGDPERFVVVFEHSGNPHGGVVQEFEYTDDPPTLTAVSAPILPASGKYPITGCTGGTPQGVSTQFDQRGNLWVTRSVGVAGGPLGIYLKDPTTGLRKLEDPSQCAASGSRPWGFPCATDLEIGKATPGAQPNATWTLPWTVHLVEDPTTGTMFAIGFAGGVTPIEVLDTANGLRFTARDKIALDPSNFFAAAAETTTKGIIDDARRALWIPIAQRETTSPPGCGFFDCTYPVGATRDSWLFRIAIDKALAFGARVTGVTAPATVTANTAFDIELTINKTSAIWAAGSYVALYLNDSSAPLACNSPSCRLTTTGCGATSCTYKATVPASMTTGTSGTLAWHAILSSSGASPSWNLHTTGRLTVTP